MLIDADELVVPPPHLKFLNYPGTLGIGVGIIFTIILVIVAGKFDPTHGALTISLLVVLAFVGTVTMCLFFTIPQDQTTAAVVGGLVAAFGAVVSFWLNHPHPTTPADKEDDEPPK